MEDWISDEDFKNVKELTLEEYNKKWAVWLEQKEKDDAAFHARCEIDEGENPDKPYWWAEGQREKYDAEVEARFEDDDCGK